MAKAYEYVIEIRAGFAKLGNDMRQVSGQFKRLEKDVTGVFKNIGAIAKSAAVLGGIVAINSLKNALVDLAKRGEAAGSIAEGFQKLGGSSASINAASKATLGLVGKFELMKLANQAMLKGIPQVNQNFAMLAEYAGRVANTLDQDTGTALDNLINGLATVKEKQLAAIGITIDADAAYRKYAQANGIAAVAGKRWEDVLTSQEQKLAKQEAAVEAVRNNMDKLAPVTDSVANAQQAYNQAIKDGLDAMGKAINNNADFAEAYRELEAAVNKIDWQALGESVGTVSGIFGSMAAKVIPGLVSEFSELARMFDVLFGDSAQAAIDRQAIKIGSLIQEAQKTGPISLSDILTNPQGAASKIKGSLSTDLKEAEKDYWALVEASESLRRSEEKLSEMRRQKAAEQRAALKAANEKAKEAEAAGKRIAEAMKAAAEETKKFNDSLDKESSKQVGDNAKKGIEEAIKSLNKASFEHYIALLKDATRDGMIESWGSGYKNSKGESRARADDLANAGATAVGKEYREKFADAAADFKKKQIEASEEASQKAKEQYNQVANEVGSAFKEAFNLSSNDTDWKSAIVDFGASLAGALTAAFETGVTENPKIIQGIADLGIALGNYLAKVLESFTSDGDSTPSDGTSIGKIATSVGQAYFNENGEKVEPIGQNNDGSFIYPEGSSSGTESQGGGAFEASGGEYAAAAGTVAGSFTKKNKPNTNSAAGAQAGAVVGTIVGAYFGQPALGAALGSQLGEMVGTVFKTGLNHAESKMRVKFEQWLEEQFKDLEKVRYYGADGKLGGYFDGDFKGKKLTQDFNETWNADGTKSPPVWTSNMDKWGEKAKSTFLGLGEAMKELRGITDDIGAQLGYILGTTLAGNIDNAKLLMLDLGLTFEEISEALLESAMKGTISWLAFNSYIRDTAEAFKPGLVAIGAISQAFQNLIDGAGQGRESVKAFKDIAVEAMEAGVKTMEGLKQYLLAQGFDPEYVEALMDAAKQRGVDSLKEWSEATDQVAGSIIGDMEAMSTKLQEEWNKMRENLKDFSKNLKEIPKEVQSTIKIKVKTEYDEKTKEVMERMGNIMPTGVPSEGERDMSETATAQTGRSGSAGGRSRTMASRLAGRVYTPATGNPFGGGVIRTPVITGTPYNVSAPGLNNKGNPNLPDNTPLAQRPGTTHINIDARGAAAGAEAAILDAARQIEANVINSIYPMIRESNMRGGRGADY